MIIGAASTARPRSKSDLSQIRFDAIMGFGFALSSRPRSFNISYHLPSSIDREDRHA